MSDIVIVIADFRAEFPAFASTSAYSDAYIQAYFDTAKVYLYPQEWCLMSAAEITEALYLMTAHMMQWQANLNAQRGQGQVGAVTASSIDKVSVTVQAPPVKNAWQQWLSLTPYGMRLWAFFSVKSSGGFYIGGSCERAGFRKFGGSF